MNDKRVIFVGGTSFSGSTMFDMMLANDPVGFSCGEVQAIYSPLKRHYLTEGCGCGNPQCSVWKKIKAGGVQNLYRRIFELHPHVQFIVDSSKDPLWIKDRTRDLQDQGVDVRNILIWKTPNEFFASRKKRGMETAWGRAWVAYHKIYFFLFKDWAAVRYKDLVTLPKNFKAVCRLLGISYREGKERYWEHTQHTLFGNTSAKIHLFAKESERFQKFKEDLNRTIEGDNAGNEQYFRRVEYVPPKIDSKERTNLEAQEYAREFQRIMAELARRDVARTDQIHSKFPFSFPEVVDLEARIVGKRVKRQLRSAWVRFKYQLEQNYLARIFSKP